MTQQTKMTSIEWLWEQIPFEFTSKRSAFEIFEQAKEMHQSEMKDAKDGLYEDDVWKVGLEDELNKLPYTKHLDDGQYNDGQLVGFELGATWGYNKAKETLYTEEQVNQKMIDFAEWCRTQYKLNGETFLIEQLFSEYKSLKQPKKD
jgi:hypothetical protein